MVLLISFLRGKKTLPRQQSGCSLYNFHAQIELSIITSWCLNKPEALTDDVRPQTIDN